MKRLTCLLFWIGVIFLVLGAIAAHAQCPGGKCPLSAAPRVSQSPGPLVSQSPTPAWRYEVQTRHTHWQAVVRVKTIDRDGHNSIGSGVLIRYSGRVVLLTARHVVRDARAVWIWLRGGWHPVRVLRVDATWDAAVGDPGEVGDVAAAELEFGEAAHPKKGDRLESCGFGPDQRFAVNSGRFLYYRAAAGQVTTDWMVLSGPARGGDSGGPIFNERGRVVGVLWGTDNSEVVGAQAGRLHVLLEEACGKWKQTAGNCLPGCTDCGGAMPAAGRPGPFMMPHPFGRNQQGPTPAPVPPIVTQTPPVDLGPVLGSLERIGGKIDAIGQRPQGDSLAAVDSEARARAAEAIGAAQQARAAAEQVGQKVDGMAAKLDETNKAVASGFDQVGKVIAPLQRIHDRLEEAAESGGIKGRIAQRIQDRIEGDGGDEPVRKTLWIVGGLVAVAGLVHYLRTGHGLVAEALKKSAERHPENEKLQEISSRLIAREEAFRARLPNVPAGIAAGLATANPVAGAAVAAGSIAADLAETLVQRVRNLEARLHATTPATPPAA